MPDDGKQQQQQQGQQQQAQQNQQSGANPFEVWLGTQPEDVKNLVNNRFHTLENTVRATREERDALKTTVKELTGKAEKGSDMEQQLTNLTSKLEAAERRAEFLEQAGRPEVGCRNASAAFALATVNNYFDKKGNPDWSAIRQSAPELFGTTTNANAGNGTGKPVSGKMSMNDAIRIKAGRQPR